MELIMKMKKHVFVYLFYFFAFTLTVILSGCSEREENNIPETSVLQESPLSDEGKRRELQRMMIEFLSIHQDEMESFAFQLKALENKDPNHSFLYVVDENVLYVFDGVHIKAEGKNTEDPILSTAAFLRDPSIFEWVAWSSQWFGCSACTFVGEVYEGSTDKLYAELFLFYSEQEPDDNEYQVVEELTENWYFYCEYRQ